MFNRLILLISPVKVNKFERFFFFFNKNNIHDKHTYIKRKINNNQTQKMLYTWKKLKSNKKQCKDKREQRKGIY